MSEWRASKKDTIQECLYSNWFLEITTQLSKLVPFPFYIKNGEKILFGEENSNRLSEKKMHLEEDVQFSIGIPEQYSLQYEKPVQQFCDLMQTILTERCQSEFNLDSLSAEVVNKYEELNVLYDLSYTLGSPLDTQRIFEVVLDKIETVLDVERASIMLFDEKAQTLEVVAARGFEIKKLEPTRISPQNTISGYVLQKGEALMLDNLNDLPSGIVLKKTGDYKSDSFISVPMICFPLQTHKKKIGVINVTEKRNGKNFSSDDLKLMNSISSMAAIAIYNNRLLEKVLESERLKRDLEIAETIQLGLLPASFPYFHDVEIYGRCRPAKNVGGDYFDLFISDNQFIDLLIADVSGHNISAAIMMANMRSVLRSLIHNTIPVNQILARANSLLFEDMYRSGFFISIFLMRYDRKKHRLTYANGGHHPALWYRSSKKEFTRLDTDGLLLGVMPKVQFEEKAIQLESSDLLVMYTDGLIETRHAGKDFYGYDNLKKIVAKSAHKSAAKLTEDVLSSVDDFAGGVSQNDDITFQVMKILA